MLPVREKAKASCPNTNIHKNMSVKVSNNTMETKPYKSLARTSPRMESFISFWVWDGSSMVSLKPSVRETERTKARQAGRTRLMSMGHCRNTAGKGNKPFPRPFPFLVSCPSYLPSPCKFCCNIAGLLNLRWCVLFLVICVIWNARCDICPYGLSQSMKREGRKGFQ